MWTNVSMESVRANLDTYLTTVVIVPLAITRMKKTENANVRFKRKKQTYIQGGMYTAFNNRRHVVLELHFITYKYLIYLS